MKDCTGVRSLVMNRPIIRNWKRVFLGIGSVLLLGTLFLFVCVFASWTVMVISSRGRMGAIKNKASCVAISTAITSYQADYGTFPVPPSALQKNGIVFLGVEPGQPPTELLPGTVDFFQALCGNVNASSGALVKTGLNPRNLQYLTLPKDRVDARGVLTQMFLYPNKPAYFSIAIDVSNSGKLKGLPNLSKGDFSDTVNDSVAVWCCNDQPFDKPNMRWATTW